MSNQPTKREVRRQRQLEKQKVRQQEDKKKSTKKSFTWGILLILIIVAIVGFTQFGGSSEPDRPVGPTFIQPDDNIDGSPDARVTLIEYSDFQCPACGFQYPMVKQISEEFAGDVSVVYRNFPLSQIHAQASDAARAAEAAGKQGKFWEMHDKLFESQTQWSGDRGAKDFFAGLAEEIGLDMNQYEADVDSSEVKDKISRDTRSGTSLGVRGTPTFFINGLRLTNPNTVDEWRSIISQVIASTPSVEQMGSEESNNDSMVAPTDTTEVPATDSAN